MIENFFTTEQVANILQVHPFTILKFIKQGKLKGIKLGRVYRIKESEVQAFLEGRSTQKESRSPHDKQSTLMEETSTTPYEIKPTEEGGEAPHYYII